MRGCTTFKLWDWNAADWADETTTCHLLMETKFHSSKCEVTWLFSNFCQMGRQGSSSPRHILKDERIHFQAAIQRFTTGSIATATTWTGNSLERCRKQLEWKGVCNNILYLKISPSCWHAKLMGCIFSWLQMLGGWKTGKPMSSLHHLPHVM